jgi:adenylate cyclase
MDGSAASQGTPSHVVYAEFCDRPLTSRKMATTRFAKIASGFLRLRRLEAADDVERQVQQIFSEAERRREVLLGYMRLAAFAMLLLLLGVLDFPGPHYSHFLSGVIYGTATAVWLVLAWMGYYRAWFAWPMTTLDVALVLHFYAMLVLYGGLPTGIALGVPGTLMIFLFLGHAAARYRPELVLYGTVLFVAGWAAIHAAADGGFQLHWPNRGDTAEIAFLLILGLTALALFLTASQARRLLVEAISEAHLRASLSRFVPAVLAEALAGPARTLLVPRSQWAAILFVDVRGFTAIAERMSPHEVVGFLNDYRRRVSAAIFDHHGMIDKFIGDGVMAVFGIPAPSFSDAANAIRGGLAILAAIDVWNAERRRDGLPPIAVGTGAHYGDIVVGAIGDDRRLEYTVIGDAVNVAQRLERICAETGERFVVSSDLIEAARRAGSPGKWRRLAVRSVRGRRQPVNLLALAEPASASAEPKQDGAVGRD